VDGAGKKDFRNEDEFWKVALDLLVALMVEAVSASETSVKCCGLLGAASQLTVVFMPAALRT
jgi:hypothetical protein